MNRWLFEREGNLVAVLTMPNGSQEVRFLLEVWPSSKPEDTIVKIGGNVILTLEYVSAEALETEDGGP